MAKSDEIFKRIEARMEKIDPANRTLEHIYKFVLFADDGKTLIKTWMLDLKSVKVYEGDDAAECTLKLKESTIIDIVSGAKDATKALMEELIDVEGDLELIGLLKPYISSVSA